MTTHAPDNAVREAREQKAWDDDHVWENCNAWANRVLHVLEGPNTRRAEWRFERMLAAAASGARILDVGCGQGYGIRRLLEHGPDHVLGIDISNEMIAAAESLFGADDRVELRLQSTQQPLDQQFDLIAGRAVLHHIDFREFLARAYTDNLRPGGRMLFIEPMGHPFTIAFHRFVRSAHSPDERPLRRSDAHWLRREFPRVTLEGINLLSFPAGIVSSWIFDSPDNRLMRVADAVDRRALSIAPWLSSYGRQAIIAIDKPDRPRLS